MCARIFQPCLGLEPMNSQANGHGLPPHYPTVRVYAEIDLSKTGNLAGQTVNSPRARCAAIHGRSRSLEETEWSADTNVPHAVVDKLEDTQVADEATEHVI